MLFCVLCLRRDRANGDVDSETFRERTIVFQIFSSGRESRATTSCSATTRRAVLIAPAPALLCGRSKEIQQEVL